MLDDLLVQDPTLSKLYRHQAVLVRRYCHCYWLLPTDKVRVEEIHWTLNLFRKWK